MTERENDLGDSDISQILEKMDPSEMAKLEMWFKSKNGGSFSDGPAGPPPPPPSAPVPVRSPYFIILII